MFVVFMIYTKEIEIKIDIPIIGKTETDKLIDF